MNLKIINLRVHDLSQLHIVHFDSAFDKLLDLQD